MRPFIRDRLQTPGDCVSIGGAVLVMAATGDSVFKKLKNLARLCGVQTAYRDQSGKERRASRNAISGILRALGHDCGNDAEIADHLRERTSARWRRGCAPIQILWDGKGGKLQLAIPSSEAEAAARLELRLESGHTRKWNDEPAERKYLRARCIEGENFRVVAIDLPSGLPSGYHDLRIEIANRVFRTRLICAPSQTFLPDQVRDQKLWGVFLPLYALHSARGLGSGDFSDLLTLTDWTRSLGGTITATLPLLPTFMDEPVEPSPYSPVSRLFWNEFYVDPTAAPEFAECDEAKKIWGQVSNDPAILAARKSRWVEYSAIDAAKQASLAAMSRKFFQGGDRQWERYRAFLSHYPKADDYALFRSHQQRAGRDWSRWDAAPREGKIAPDSVDLETRRRWLYAQCLAHEQLSNLAGRSRIGGAPGLYLDLPLGVHPHGYDAWRHRDRFAFGASAGAPPDEFFSKGQNWGFPPLHPESDREQGYEYTIAYIQNQLRYAGILRIDHVMGLHRLYWIPGGASSTDGAYVRSRAEELYAILSVESHRRRAMIVGENLGTVPNETRAAMTRHGVTGMSVAQFDFRESAHDAIPSPPADSVLSLNTHDLPTFAAFWEGADIADRVSLDLLDSKEARAETETRVRVKSALLRFLSERGKIPSGKADALEALAGCLKILASSDARIVMVSLEDLWLEIQPQNTPGIGPERPSWRRKSRLSFEEFKELDGVVRLLKEIHARRSGKGAALNT